MNYVYSKSTGRLLGTSVHLVDSYQCGSTETPPPSSTDESEVYIWNGSVWILAPQRNTTRVSRRQGKQQLVLSNLDQKVEAAIEAIADPVQKKLTRIWYNDADYWELENSELQGLASLLYLTDEDLFKLFESASRL